MVPLTVDPAEIADLVARVVRELAAGYVPKVALTITETAHALGISRAVAYRLVKNGELPFVSIGTRKVVPVHALEEWARVHTHPAISTAA